MMHIRLESRVVARVNHVVELLARRLWRTISEYLRGRKFQE
jgi:hypothetical protein